MFLLHLLILLSHLTRIHAEGWHDSGYFGQFSVVNPGRMYHHTVLMHLEKMDLEECILFCMRHQECVSASFSESTQECELNDMEFNDTEGDPHAVGWVNYYRPPMIHGQFSEWKLKADCSSTCGKGVIVYERLCDNPRPQFGGDQCEGAYVKTYVNVAKGKPSSQISTYTHNVANRGNDGDIGTVSVTERALNPWWKVDLEQDIQIQLIKIFLENDSFGKGLYPGLKVMTKSDSWTVCKEYIGTATSLQIDVQCDVASTTARYVKVEIENSNHLNLAEVEVYAK